jgi:hypothetical protein
VKLWHAPQIHFWASVVVFRWLAWANSSNPVCPKLRGSKKRMSYYHYNASFLAASKRINRISVSQSIPPNRKGHLMTRNVEHPMRDNCHLTHIPLGT